VDTPLLASRIGFKDFWTDASYVAMASRAIVEGFNVVGHICFRQVSCFVDPLLDPLLLQARKEGFSDRIVPAVTSPAHARLKTIRSAEASLVIAAVLASLVGVDHGAFRTPAPYCHHDGIQDELAAQTRAGGPAHNQPAEQIHDDRQIEPTLPGPNVRDISDPDLVRADDVEVSLDQVRRDDSGFASGVVASSVAMESPDVVCSH